MNLEEKNLDSTQEINVHNPEDKINLLSASSNLTVNNANKIEINKENYDITSEQLENVVSNYTDLSNKTTLLESIELLGGTNGIIKKLNSSVDEGIKTLLKQE